MAGPGRRLSPDQLIDYARVEGLNPLPSRPQIGRWRRAGILPPIEVQWQGRARGRASLFPESAKHSLLAIYRAHQADGRCRRSLPLLRWLLWWEGELIDVARVRLDLQRAIEKGQRGLQQLGQRLSLAGEEDGDDLFDKWARRPATLSVLRAVQSQLSPGPYGYANVLRGMVGALSGDTAQEFGAYRLEFLFGLGFASSLLDAANPDSPWASADVESVVREVTRAGSPAAMTASLHAASDADLLAVRQETRALCRLHDLIRSSPLADSGLRSSHALLPPKPTASQSMALFLIWLAFRGYSAFQPFVRRLQSVTVPNADVRTVRGDADA